MALARSLLLVGTGLVGGSFALAAKAAGLFDRVVGVDRDADALAEAVARGVVDATAHEPSEDFQAACVAVPVAAIAERVREAAQVAPVVFDVGSVKQSVIDALRPPLSGFVPCHPIAGGSRGGAAAARADLFRERPVVLTPTNATDADAVATVRRYWQAVGARVVVEDAAAHDERFAKLSHLPHLLAFAYVELAARADDLHDVGAGFRDFTRIAGADADVWTDILRANADPVLRHLDELIAGLRDFAATLRADRECLRARIAAIAEQRRMLDSHTAN